MRKDSQKAKSIHESAILAFDKIQSAVYEERQQCAEDRRFANIAGAQWEGSLEEQFENKPKFEVNKVNKAVLRIINEYRNNRITVDFIAKDGLKNDNMADICDGLYRADEQDSSANEAYDTSFEEAVTGGFGAFRLTSEYEDEEDDENEKQRIRILPIYDADSSVFFDLDAKRHDKADARFCFVMYSLTPEEYEEEYGKVAPTSLSKDIGYGEYDWFKPDEVFIAEYYRIETVKETIHVYQNLTGQEVRYTDEDFADDPALEERLAQIGTQKLREKKVRRRKVHKYIIDGREILEDCGIIAGKHIPIVPVYGKRCIIDSVERCMGHVRLAKDVQRIKNMLTSKLAEISSLSTVEKPIVTPEQMAGNEVMWAEDNIKNYPYMLLNPVDNGAGSQPMGPIGYTKPPAIPPALAALMQQADIDAKEILGNQDQADKMLSHVSGKSQELLQQRIDGQAFIYMSNFAKSVRRAGEIWLSMAKDLYVEKGRRMKTIDSMGEMDSVELLSEGLDENNVPMELNDLSKATFDVTVSVGPSSESQRAATVQSLIGMLSVVQDQETAQVLQMMTMMNMEGEGIGEARGFFRKRLVQMGVIQPTKEEAEQMAEAAKNAKPSAQDQMMLSMAQEAQAKAQKAQMEAQMEGPKSVAEVELNRAKTADIYAGIEQAGVETGIKINDAINNMQLPNV